MCISDAKGCLRHAKRLCMLNPLTRTCKLVPPVPIPWIWGATVQVKHLHSGALTVLIDTGAFETWPQGLALATYDLETAGGEWTVVRAPPGLDTTTWRHKVSRRHLVTCGVVSSLGLRSALLLSAFGKRSSIQV